MSPANTDRIRALNDAFRRSFSGGRIMMTPGVSALGYEHQAAIFQLVRTYEDFDPGNDPYAEHDFGAFDYQGQRFLWKIDAYGQFLKFGSEDPANPDITTSVLMIMRADEY